MNKILKKDFSSFNGYAFVTAVLKEADPIWRSQLLTKLDGKNPIFRKIYDQLHFTFFDLARVEEKCLSLIWQTVTEQELLVAWKLTPDALRTYLLQGVSERRRQEFSAQFAKLPKMPKKQVARTQMMIANKILKQIEEGKISLRSARYLRGSKASLKPSPTK